MSLSLGRVRQTSSFVASQLILIAVIAMARLVVASAATAAADSPTVQPATGGAGVPLVFGSFVDVDSVGYQTAEYFLSGNAHSYTTAASLTPDGKWNAVSPNPSAAAYKTRAIVHRPKKAKRFNGTVYVEWLNVSGQVDGAPDWVHGHLEALRQGAAFVLVSAQAVGVNQLKNGNVVAPGDPGRYGSLNHPGDSYSYDIVSQVAQAVWDGALLGELVPHRVFALGESQSAGRLVTYINAVQPLVDVFDGFVVHSRGAGGAALSQAPLPSITVPLTEIRNDLAVPVIVFQAETDVSNSRLLARQPETSDGKFRLWEVAGTAHFDLYGLTFGLVDTGDGQAEIDNLTAMRQGPPTTPIPGFECSLPINAGPMHWVYGASLRWLNQWASFGTPPPIAPRLEATTAPGVSPVVFAVDEHGNTVGGIRTPYVDVPIARLGGVGNSAAPGSPPGLSAFCGSFGVTVPFTEERLAELYPNHASFVFSYLIASLEAVRSQYVHPADALALLLAATRSDIGN